MRQRDEMLRYSKLYNSFISSGIIIVHWRIYIMVQLHIGLICFASLFVNRNWSSSQIVWMIQWCVFVVNVRSQLNIFHVFALCWSCFFPFLNTWKGNSFLKDYTFYYLHIRKLRLLEISSIGLKLFRVFHSLFIHIYKNEDIG